MFWGLVIAGGKKHSQKVEEPFHVSMAAIELPVTDTDRTFSVILDYKETSFVLCSLSPKDGIYQVPLSLHFEKGSDLAFHVGGASKKTRVYLTGYYLTSSLGSTSSLVMSTPSTSAIAIPIKAQHSILVSGRKPTGDSAAKKHVSIREEHEERELSDDGEDRRMSLNGSMFQFGDSDDEDEDEEEEDDDTDEDEDEEDEDDDDDSLDDEEEDYGEYIAIPSVGAGRETEKKKKKVKPILLNLDDEDGDAQLPKVTEVGTPKGPTKKEKKANDQKTPETQKKSPSEFKTPEQDIKIKTPSSVGNTPMKFVAKGGVMVQEVKIGSGVPARPGKMVTVNYVGRLKNNNRQFDKGQITFRVGKGEVIKGWDVGLEGMKVGGKRKLIIPPNLAYGKKGAAPDIPANSTLTFDLDLTKVS